MIKCNVYHFMCVNMISNISVCKYCLKYGAMMFHGDLLSNITLANPYQPKCGDGKRSWHELNMALFEQKTQRRRKPKSGFA